MLLYALGFIVIVFFVWMWGGFWCGLLDLTEPEDLDT